MRLIGTVPSKQHAERISAFLVTQEISTHFEEDKDAWQIWVRDEDRLGDAKGMLETFRQNPDDTRYKKAVDEAQKIAREKEREAQEAKSKQVQMTSDRWTSPLHKVAPLTVAIIVICVAVGFLTGFGDNNSSEVVKALAFSSLTNEQAVQVAGEEILQDGDAFSTPLRLGSLMRGEFWRAITPIFIHWSVIHILFNMYWLVIFGRQIEYRYGTKWMALLVITIAVVSNIAGCIVPESLDGIPIAFNGIHWLVLLGGMSGVNYGLFGFVWMKMTFDPKSNLFVSASTIMILMIWMLFCMLPEDNELKQMIGMPSVANWAHGIGLLVGLAIGYAPKLLSDLGFGRSAEKK